jgi:hypothetical protein
MTSEVKTAKNSKLPKLSENYFEELEKVGGHQYPPGSVPSFLLFFHIQHLRVKVQTSKESFKRKLSNRSVDCFVLIVLYTYQIFI